MRIPVVHPEAATFATMTPAGIRILAALDNATRVLNIDLVITCGTEDHAPDDPHTRGEAYDIRVRGIPTALLLKLITFLQQVLGPLFTILLETPVTLLEPQLAAIQTINPHATAPHLHIQSKRGTIYPPLDGTVKA